MKEITEINELWWRLRRKWGISVNLYVVGWLQENSNLGGQLYSPIDLDVWRKDERGRENLSQELFSARHILLPIQLYTKQIK